MDKIVQGNTSNIVFLKSTDDTMIQQLETMSGKTHEVRKDSKTITKDKERLFMQTEGKISITMSVKEKPVISYNDMAFINPRNSIVFRAGDSPIWNRNQTILPMSWKLFSDTIVQPGKNYTLQTIPTLSSALDFDVRKNQPNFQVMVEKRVLQARYADEAVEAYKKAYGYTDYDVEQLDPDVYSDEIMEIINQAVREHLAEKEGVAEEELPPEFDLMDEINSMIDPGDYEDNEEQFRENEHYREIYDDMDNMKFADGNVSPNMLVGFNGKANHAHDGMLVAAFRDARSAMFHDTQHFMDRGDGSLYGADGTLFIYKMPETNAHAKINAAMQDEGTNVYGEEDVTQDDIDIIGGYVVKDAFIIWLSKLDAWDFAAGRFEEAVVREYNKQV